MTDREAFEALMQRFGAPIEVLDLGSSGSCLEIQFDGNSRGPVRRVGLDNVSFTFAADGSFEWIEVP